MDLEAERGVLPRHVAIIMDGNGRWAVRQGRPRTYGHHRGVERVREILRAAVESGIEVLTLYAFSTENWRRPEYEVSVLMRLFRHYIVREVDEIDRADIRVRFIGEREGLPADLQRVMARMEERTAENRRLLVQVALNYGSRREMVRAIRRLAVRAAEGKIDPATINEETVSAALDTAGVPDPDLVIRTSGEMRVSNFLLWQAAYAEFVFVEECWPDFTAERFAEVLEAYGRRERRFGGLGAALSGG